MEEINSRETLEAWLKDKPPTWAAAIALRCALRVLPIALNPLLFQKTYDQPRFVSVLFRALAIAAGTGAYPRADAVNVAAIVAANAAVHTAAKAVYFTTNVHDHVYGADAVNAAIDATPTTIAIT